MEVILCSLTLVKSSQFYLYSSNIKNHDLPEGALQSVRQTPNPIYP